MKRSLVVYGRRRISKGVKPIVEMQPKVVKPLSSAHASSATTRMREEVRLQPLLVPIMYIYILEWEKNGLKIVLSSLFATFFPLSNPILTSFLYTRLIESPHESSDDKLRWSFQGGC